MEKGRERGSKKMWWNEDEDGEGGGGEENWNEDNGGRGITIGMKKMGERSASRSKLDSFYLENE